MTKTVVTLLEYNSFREHVIMSIKESITDELKPIEVEIPMRSGWFSYGVMVNLEKVL